MNDVVEVSYRRNKPVKALKRPKVKRKKPKGISSYKKALDTIFSQYIRAKYEKTCYTCRGGGKVLQCGHFVSRMYLYTRWNEDNARPQCRMCNCLMNGRAVDFEERLIQEIGEARVYALKRDRKILTKLSLDDYLERISYFQEKLKSLEG